jgi:hypothetical protein
MAAHGLWVNMMCIAHECEPYGHLVVNAKPMQSQQIARLVGLSVKEFDKLCGELADAGVVSVSAEGAFFSRRMVRDENLRTVRANGGEGGSEFGHLGAEHGKKGGRPKKVTGDKKPPLPDEKQPAIEPPPSSSSSSSSSTSVIKEANASSSTSDEPKIADCPHEVIIGLFAKHMPELPKPRLELWRSGKNAKALAQRWRWVLTAKKSSGERYAQTADDAVAWFDRYFGYVAESDFLMGRKTEFACNMAWLVKAENFEKVLSGNFHKEMKVAA